MTQKESITSCVFDNIPLPLLQSLSFDLSLCGYEDGVSRRPKSISYAGLCIVEV